MLDFFTFEEYLKHVEKDLSDHNERLPKNIKDSMGDIFKISRNELKTLLDDDSLKDED